jgi:hypothetical protein
MAKQSPQLSQLVETTRQPPPQPGGFTQVQVVEAPSYVGPPQPTIADVLRALQDLGQKIHQVSKNQQALESRHESVRKRVDAVHSNTITGAEWLRTWSYCVLMNLGDPPSPFIPSGVTEPHWK